MEEKSEEENDKGKRTTHEGEEQVEEYSKRMNIFRL
jgi:hypothetical protein